MPTKSIQEMLIDELLASPAGQLLQKALQTIENVQQNLYALATSEDSNKLKLLKIGTVFQIFLVDLHLFIFSNNKGMILKRN